MTKDEFIEACNERMADPRFRTRVKIRHDVFHSMREIRRLATCRYMQKLREKKDAKPELQ